MSPFTFHNNTSLPKDVLKSIAEPPDIACTHLFEPGGGCECGTPNLFWGIEGYVYLQTFLFKDLLSQSCSLGVYLSLSIKSAPKIYYKLDGSTTQRWYNIVTLYGL